LNPLDSVNYFHFKGRARRALRAPRAAKSCESTMNRQSHKVNFQRTASSEDETSGHCRASDGASTPFFRGTGETVARKLGPCERTLRRGLRRRRRPFHPTGRPPSFKSFLRKNSRLVEFFISFEYSTT